MAQLTRKEIRYFLGRLRTHAVTSEQAKQYDNVTPVELPDLPDGFLKTFESQDKFRGWKNFMVIWDVDIEDPWTIVFRNKSVEEEWNETLAQVVPELPKKGDKKKGK